PQRGGGGGGGGGGEENQYPRWLSVQNHLVGMYRRSNASERDRCEQIRPTPSESYGRQCVLIAGTARVFVARHRSAHTSWISSATPQGSLSRSMGGSTSNQNRSSAMPAEMLILPAKAFVFCASTIMTS